MRPVEFTSEQIIKAGLELQAAGRPITAAILNLNSPSNPTPIQAPWPAYV